MSHINTAATAAPLSSPLPDSRMLIDRFGRRINYVRLAVTDRCNLRCAYCMPEKGMRFLPNGQLLSFPEMERLMGILASLGVDKVRITGGEPFVRPGIMDFLRRLRQMEGIRQISITTNGVLTGQYLAELKDLGIAGINLSLDSLERERFLRITRRDAFDEVMACFHRALDDEIPLKINMVLMGDLNSADIIPMARLSKAYPVEVRFIEEMPFNGTDQGKSRLNWDYRRIIRTLEEAFPGMQPREDAPTSTSQNFTIPGHRGTVGVIAGFSRTFCGTCNRIRITSRGTLKTCLYGKGELDVKALLRSRADDSAIENAFRLQVRRRFKDGWEAEQDARDGTGVSESMSVIGG